MRYGSVCSGIEAATTAWHTLGWEASFFSEIEAFPSAVLKHHYPAVENRGDMNRFKDWPRESIDLLVGGTPCQSFSVAGLREGMADPRGRLALVFLAIADRLRPRWVVWENVPGVLSKNEGRDFASIVGGLGQLGYGWAYRVLDAQFFGVPQRRRRVFLVGYLGDWRRAAAVLFERKGLSWDPPPSRKAGQGTAPCLEARTRSGGGPGTDAACDSALIDVPDSAHALNAHAGPHGRLDATNETFITHALTGEGHDASEDGTGRGTPIIPLDMRQLSRGEKLTNNRKGGGGPPGMGIGADGDPAATLGTEHPSAVALPITLAVRGRGDGRDLEIRQDGLANAILTPNGGRDGMGVGAIAFDTTQITHPENRCNPQPGDPCHPLATHGHPPALAFSSKDHGDDAGEVAPTMRGMSNADSHANGGGQIAVQRGMAVRRLTPLECERLQGFPDGYTLIKYGKKLAADGPRYKALGNSMAVTVMAWIGRRIDVVDAIPGR